MSNKKWKAIGSARAAGLSLRMIGEACMISHQTVITSSIG